MLGFGVLPMLVALLWPLGRAPIHGLIGASLQITFYFFHQSPQNHRYTIRTARNTRFAFQIEHLVLTTLKEITMTTKTTAQQFRTAIAIALFGAGVSTFAALPAAADGFDAPQITVKYQDLDVSTQQGAAALYARIRGAAKSVCSQFDHYGIDAAMWRNACMDKAILGAVIKVNSAALYAVSGVKPGREVSTRLVANSK
jgi:UrcA family protein